MTEGGVYKTHEYLAAHTNMVAQIVKMWYTQPLGLRLDLVLDVTEKPKLKNEARAEKHRNIIQTCD